MNYFGRMKKIWDDLSNYDTLPTCKCQGCRCDIIGTLMTRREEERVREFLMGLDPGYAAVRSHILGLEPLPNLNQVYSKLIQEEGVRLFTQSQIDSRPEPLAFTVRSPTPGHGTRGARKDSWDKKEDSTREAKPKCTACHREGHTASTCFGIIGFPDWWGDRPRWHITTPTTIASSDGGRGGDQPAWGRGRGYKGQGRGFPRVNVATTPSNARGPSLTDKDRVDLNHLSASEWDELVALWLSQKNTTTSDDNLDGKTFDHLWIIDTGASHHMSGTLAYFSNVIDIDPCPVGQPNGV
ncbi:hypothetical protein RND81_10G102800 [Saponaria officinalis]|uniref:Uncharacterized protein n=1 Tax=Saponaria officinalis TaxID=3572 RepID=A0AAW1I0X8_SAPOF